MKTNVLILTILGVVLIANSGFRPGVKHFRPEAKHGDTFELHKYKGKIVVLNFWASWSKASRAENKNLLRVYQVYRLNQKVVFASISLDTDEAAWKAAIEEDDLKWKDHFCDFKKYDSPMAVRFNITTLPKYFVFDGTGKQVSSSTNSHDLETVISGLLK